MWTYRFNHEEAMVCFERAAEADPGCAMPYWCIAYAPGPNCKKPWESFDANDPRSTVTRTHGAVRRAAELAGHALMGPGAPPPQ